MVRRNTYSGCIATFIYFGLLIMATKAQNYMAKLLSAKKFKTVPHQWNGKICSWVYCTGCGLVALRNDSTRKRMQQGCESMED